VCGNYIIDLNGIYEILPEGKRPWLSGSWINGNANNSRLGFEICEPSKSKDTQEAAADLYGKTLFLCVHLCRTYKMNPALVQAHYELRKIGLASNHGDVSHWWGKAGTSWEPYTMDRLRADIAAEIGVPIRYSTFIKRGFRGDAVRFLQDTLVSAGYKVAADGVFGYVTQNALRAYQKVRGLKADGICGPKTWDVIYSK
jgi:N-acetyl-anhydromuramyl-L-alanine amidase AmpD